MVTMADRVHTAKSDETTPSAAGIRALADLCFQAGVEEIEVADGSWSVRLKLDLATDGAVRRRAAEATPDEVSGPYALLSQWVGVFHRAGESGAPSYVEEGQPVEEGTLLGVIAAMQLQHEVRSDRVGMLLRFLVQDRTAVEFGQPLVEIG